jgi:hypothetical protein
LLAGHAEDGDVRGEGAEVDLKSKPLTADERGFARIERPDLRVPESERSADERGYYGL